MEHIWFSVNIKISHGGFEVKRPDITGTPGAASCGPPLLGWKVTTVTASAHLRVSLFTPQNKTPEGRMVGLSGHPNSTPQDPGREAESSGSGLLTPLHKYRQGRGSSGELTQSFHPAEAHFRGMQLFLHLDRSPVRWRWTQGLTGLFSQTGLFGFDSASRCMSLRLLQTLLWEDQAGSVHSWCSVTIQTCTKSVSNRQKDTGLNTTTILKCFSCYTVLKHEH